MTNEEILILEDLKTKHQRKLAINQELTLVTQQKLTCEFRLNQLEQELTNTNDLINGICNLSNTVSTEFNNWKDSQ